MHEKLSDAKLHTPNISENRHYRNCSRCGKDFITYTKYGRVCEDCNNRPDLKRKKLKK